MASDRNNPPGFEGSCRVLTPQSNPMRYTPGHRAPVSTDPGGQGTPRNSADLLIAVDKVPTGQMDIPLPPARGRG